MIGEAGACPISATHSLGHGVVTPLDIEGRVSRLCGADVALMEQGAVRRRGQYRRIY
jgi:hypothetical protein